MSALDTLIYAPRLVLAQSEEPAPALGSDIDGETFFQSGLGLLIQNVFIGVGILICVAGLVKVVGAALKGQIGSAMKAFVGTVVLAAFCFNLDLITTLIDLAGGAVRAAVDTFNGQAGG